VTLAVLLILLAAYTYTVQKKYTPIFQRIDCKPVKGPPHTIDHHGLELHVRSQSMSQCTNPNNFDLRTLGGGGTVLLMPQKTVIGTVTVLPHSVHGPGVGFTSNQIDLDVRGFQAAEVIAQLLEGPSDIVLNFTITSRMEMSYLGLTKENEATRHPYCGFKLHLAMGEQGPARCAGSIADLRIPEIDHPPIVQHIMMPPDKFETASRARDIAATAIIFVSFLSGLLLLLCGCRALSASPPRLKKGNTSEKRKFVASEDPLE